jgi:hypothetical protein
VPRTKKPRSQAADRRNGRLVPLASDRIEPPDLPPGLCSEAVAEWGSYWSDPVSRAPTPADRDLLLRWVTSINRYWVSTREADEKPIVLGSTGQQVQNPLYRVAELALAAAERCERQLGIGAKNRADLGLAIVSEQRSLAEMNARYEESAGADSDDSEDQETDPRLAVVRGEVV